MGYIHVGLDVKSGRPPSSKPAAEVVPGEEEGRCCAPKIDLGSEMADDIWAIFDTADHSGPSDFWQMPLKNIVTVRRR